MMKDVELLLHRSQSCRGITVIDKANKSDFVGGTGLDSKGQHRHYSLWQCHPVKYKVSLTCTELSHSHMEKNRKEMGKIHFMMFFLI